MEDKRRTYGNEAVSLITPLDLNLSSEWQQKEVLFGRLHSKFERVENYLFWIDSEERMLTIMCEGNTLLPDSVILRYEDYEKIKKRGACSITKLKDYIQINDIKIDLMKTSSCSLLKLSLNQYKKESFEQKRKQVEDFIAHSERRSDFDRLPKRYQKLLERFADALINNDSKNLKEAFLSLIGAGRGLTPAADDAMIGVLAGYLLRRSIEKKTGNYLKTMQPILSDLCNRKLTTEVSLKYLKCACRGMFSQDLCELIMVLSGTLHKDIKVLLERIRETGHSSGMDMLYGLDTILKRG